MIGLLIGLTLGVGICEIACRYLNHSSIVINTIDWFKCLGS